MIYRFLLIIRYRKHMFHVLELLFLNSNASHIDNLNIVIVYYLNNKGFFNYSGSKINWFGLCCAKTSPFLLFVSKVFQEYVSSTLSIIFIISIISEPFILN